MKDAIVKLTDEIQRDPYPHDHPWSIRIDNNGWGQAISIRQGGLGIRPIYILTNESHQIIGSNFETLASMADRLTPCIEARLEMLLFGHLSGSRTLYSEIERFPPGDRHLVTSAGIRSEWTDRICDLGRTSLDDVASLFISGLKKQIDIEPSGWLPLTGGIDSRTIASVVGNTAGIRSYTRGSRKNYEVKRAEKVSAIIGMNHYPMPFQESYLQQNARKIVQLTGGMISIDHGHAIHPIAHLNRLSGGLAIPGLNGEYGRSFWKADDCRMGNCSEGDIAFQLFNLVDITKKRRYAKLFSKETEPILNQLRDEFIERYRLCAEFARYSHPVAWNDEFYLRERVRSFTSFGAVIWNSIFHLVLPFLDSDYIQAVRHLPPQLRIEPQIHCEIIRRTYPALLRVPLHPKDRPLELKFLDFIGIAARKLMKKLTAGRHRKSAQNYPGWLREGSAFWEQLLVKAHESACGLIDPSVVQGLWKEHKNGADHHRILCRLATLYLSDEVFVGKTIRRSGDNQNES
ncbi:hypothetical protein JW823_07040 [bacterium]|nr:hypothetical protein [candidate division CSSED10-310 bacterium]